MTCFKGSHSAIGTTSLPFTVISTSCNGVIADLLTLSTSATTTCITLRAVALPLPAASSTFSMTVAMGRDAEATEFAAVFLTTLATSCAEADSSSLMMFSAARTSDRNDSECPSTIRKYSGRASLYGDSF